jgi:hypothetical protein
MVGSVLRGRRLSAFTLGNVSPGRTYHFRLDTVTEPHSSNPNAVASEGSAEVSAVTTMVPPDVVFDVTGHFE